MRMLFLRNFGSVATNVSRLHEVAMNQDQAITNINKTLN